MNENYKYAITSVHKVNGDTVGYCVIDLKSSKEIRVKVEEAIRMCMNGEVINFTVYKCNGEYRLRGRNGYSVEALTCIELSNKGDAVKYIEEAIHIVERTLGVKLRKRSENIGKGEVHYVSEIKSGGLSFELVVNYIYKKRWINVLKKENKVIVYGCVEKDTVSLEDAALKASRVVEANKREKKRTGLRSLIYTVDVYAEAVEMIHPV